MDDQNAMEENVGSDLNKPINNVEGNRRITLRRSSKANWTEEEDTKLHEAVQRYHGKSWKKIAKCLSGRTDVQCLHRWQKVLDPQLVKGSWSKEEDEILIQLVGTSLQEDRIKWSEIAKHLPGRIGKQCRERWSNHLDPNIKKDPWTKEEEDTIVAAHSELGNKWSIIAKRVPGRSENSVKNHWNSSLKKRCHQASISRSSSRENAEIDAMNGSNNRDSLLQQHEPSGSLCNENGAITCSHNLGLNDSDDPEKESSDMKSEEPYNWFEAMISMLRNAAAKFKNPPSCYKKAKLRNVRSEDE